MITRSSLPTGAHPGAAGPLARVTLFGLSVVLATLGFAFSAVPALAEPLFVVTGRGYGHGIGLSQVGAQGYAQHGYSYAWILNHYFSGTTVGSVTGRRTVRVALDAVDAPRPVWTLRAAEGTMVVTGDDNLTKKLAPSRYFSFVVSGVYIKVFDDSNGNGKQAAGDGFVFNAKGRARVSVQARPGLVAAIQVHSISGPPCWDSPSGEVSIPDVRWRGSIRLVPSGSRVLAFNDVDMEDYLRGVVPRESPSYYKPEALKAQAVAARGYVLCSPAPTKLFDVYCTTASQVYGGYGQISGSRTVAHEYASTDLAVSQTAGKVVKYGSTIVKSYFFANSGGRTESVENVWGGSPVPYYKSVLDPYESVTAYWRIWPAKTFTAAQLRAKLLAKGLPVPRVLTDVVVTKRGAGQRIVTVVLKGTGGDDKTLPLSMIDRFRSAVGGHDHWIYITRSTVSAPTTVQYGVPFPVKVAVSPGYTGTVTLAYGPAAAATLSGRTKAALNRGAGTGTVPGLTAASDLMVSNGSAGSAVLFQSPRVRISVTRRMSVRIVTTGRSMGLSAVVAPAKAGLPVTFEVLAPRSTVWRSVAVKPLTAAGTVSAASFATATGTWAVRVRTPASAGFVAGTSVATKVTITK